MKIASILLSLCPLWLSNCVSVDPKKSTDDLVALWSPIIAYLNQGDVLESHTSMDLKELYNEELAQIDEKWRTKKNQTNSELKKHEFFYEQIKKLNLKEFKKPTTNPKNEYLAIASLVIHQVENHPTASSKNVWAYEQGSQIGFCFGRAMLVHYYLLKSGVLPKDIVKVFALGDLFLGGQFWRFHVAMAIKSPKGLIVVDPLYGEPTGIDQWMNNVASIEIKHPLSRARFYLTDPRKFMPTSGIYALKDMMHPVLLPYFSDLVHNLP